MNSFRSDNVAITRHPPSSSLMDWLLKMTLLAVIISVFVPLSPKMPAPGLDSSWALGLNQAVAKGLAFGKDIIFTLGPYSSIYTKAYHPATDLMMIGGSLYLASTYWLAIILLMRGIKWQWTLALGISLFGMLYARDTLFFSYPLLAGLCCFKLLSKAYKKCRLGPGPNPQVFYPKSDEVLKLSIIAALFAPFGLLPLIKGSILILCLTVTLLCFLFFTLYKKYAQAFICVLSPIASMLLFWEASGQSLLNIPSYFISSLSMASSFSQAMSTDGNSNEVILYLITSALILLVISWQKYPSKIAKSFLLCLFFVFLFLSFKAGFTRHLGHAYISGTSILIAAFLLPYILNSRIIIPAIICSIVTASYIVGNYTNISIGNNILSTYTSTWHGLKNRLTGTHWPRQNFDLMINFLRNQATFPDLPGTTDIYSYNQAYLIPSNMTWSPRPIFQSYSVFNAQQAEKNKQHLLGKLRPDNIIFKVEPIDDRLPSLEDGASWPILLSDYQPTRFIKDFLFLRHNNRSYLKPLKQLQSETHFLREQVQVPDTNQPLFAEIEIKPTLYGHLANLFYKSAPLLIHVKLNNGIEKQYRLIANMAESVFLLSPLIENTNEFALLYQNKQLLDPHKVKYLSIASNQSRHWSDRYTIRFKSM